MASSFPLNVAYKHDTYDVRYFTVEPGSTFLAGDLVFFDTATQTLKICGANPALIAGIAMAPASVGLATAGSLYGGSKIPVCLLKTSTVCFIASTQTPAVTNIGTAYDITQATGIVKLNTASTANARAFVQDISNTPQQEGFFVTFIAANLQFDAIAS